MKSRQALMQAPSVIETMRAGSPWAGASPVSLTAAAQKRSPPGK
ncbi:hypothetical protein [Xanthomonas cerealis]|nr:hypothetical protein [Xanthomonas translucens]